MKNSKDFEYGQYYFKNLDNITYENESVKHVGLIKWPSFIVKGEKIKEEQAWEILLRTQDDYYTNDKRNKRKIHKILEKPLYDDFVPERDDTESLQEYEERRKRYFQKYLLASNKYGKKIKSIGLYYIKNEAVCSCWGGGANSWIQWNGEIVNTDGKNIGKYPTVIEVANDWGAIAKNFPYLNLKCQLWNCEAWFPETVDNDPKPVVEFEIVNGQVIVQFPKKIIGWPKNWDFDPQMNELGIELKKLKEIKVHLFGEKMFEMENKIGGNFIIE